MNNFWEFIEKQEWQALVGHPVLDQKLSIILLEFQKEAANKSTETEILNFVQICQQALITKNSIDAEILLHEIETLFPNYINIKCRVSKRRKANFLERINTTYLAFQKTLSFLSSDKLAQLIITEIEQIIKGQLTHRELAYFEDFFNCYQLHQPMMKECQIFDFLIAANFNHLEVYHAILVNLRNELYASDSQQLQLDILLNFYKNKSQLIQGTSGGFHSILLTLKELTVNWARLETKHLKEKLRLASHGQTNLDFIKHNKINTTLSVSQLACLSRAFVEAGIYSDKVALELFETLGHCFSSKRMETISAANIKNKFYEIESNTQSSVIAILQEAVIAIQGFNK